MAIILEKNQVCKYSDVCPHNTGVVTICRGADPNREVTFVCDLIREDGTFYENKFRNKFDETGKMKVILENEQ